MPPMQWSGNVKLPYYGWFGKFDCASEKEARAFVAKMLRSARLDRKSLRPSYSGRCYTIKAQLMRFD